MDIPKNSAANTANPVRQKIAMHILHVAASLGPESAAGRLCTSLSREGCTVSSLGIEPPAFDDGHFFSDSALQIRWRRRLGHIALRLHTQRDITMPWTSPWCGYSLAKWIKKLNPNVVHMHWIAASTVSLPSLATLHVPIVWTFHDMWPLTAGCHCHLDCKQWQNQCSTCPQLGRGMIGFDMSHLAWEYKKQAYHKLKHVYAIGPSRWMTKMASLSPLWQGRPCVHLGNALDTHIFASRDRDVARKQWGLPNDVPILLFGATSSGIPYKGFDLLIKALHILKAQGKKLHLAIFGEHNEADMPIPCTCVGFVSEPSKLASLYSASDIFVTPSRQDNLPTTLIEASACETPCVAFDIGGISDIITHNQHGYLASPFDVMDLAQGISLLLENPALRKQWGKVARNHVLTHFESSLIARQHISFYEEIIQRADRD